MKILKILLIILNHPLNKKRKFSAFIRFIKWQIFSRFFKFPVLLPFTNNSNYLCWKGLTGITGNYYYGLMEMEEMSFAAHFLSSEDIFYDIGANVGAYSILTSSHCECKVYSFEPHPQTFTYLTRNINIQNKSDLIKAFNFGLSDKKEFVSFSTNLDTVNHVAVDKSVPTINLEFFVLNELNLPIPTMIKLDVEGFEYMVLKGATLLLKNPTLKAIIIEINGSGIKYGVSDIQIHEFLINFGFKPFTYNPFHKKLIQLDSFLTHNTIYLRDIEYCEKKIQNSKPLQLANGGIL